MTVTVEVDGAGVAEVIAVAVVGTMCKRLEQKGSATRPASSKATKLPIS